MPERKFNPISQKIQSLSDVVRYFYRKFLRLETFSDQYQQAAFQKYDEQYLSAGDHERVFKFLLEVVELSSRRGAE